MENNCEVKLFFMLQNWELLNLDLGAEELFVYTALDTSRVCQCVQARTGGSKWIDEDGVRWFRMVG